MKKLFLILTLVGLICSIGVVETKAQKKFLSEYGFDTDTVTDAGVISMKVKAAGDAYFTSIQVIVDELSGATDGTVECRCSFDGTNFSTITLPDSSVTANIEVFEQADQAAAQSYLWRISGNPCIWYELLVTGAGTMSATVRGYLYQSKNN